MPIKCSLDMYFNYLILQLRGFPARFKSKKSLIETFSRVIWLLTAQHAAVSYPLSDYGSYVPNVSAKLYDDQGVPADVFTAERLENRKTSMVNIIKI